MFPFQEQYFVMYETRIGLIDWVTLSGSLLITGLKIIFILCFYVLLITHTCQETEWRYFYRHFSVYSWVKYDGISTTLFSTFSIASQLT